jgi:hypothetical protein
MMAPMALGTYALSRRKGADAKAKAAIRSRMLTAARAIVESTEAQSLPCQPQANGFCLGLERNRCAVWHGFDDRQRNRAQS